jgi:hypothetical protein
MILIRVSDRGNRGVEVARVADLQIISAAEKGGGNK